MSHSEMEISGDLPKIIGNEENLYEGVAERQTREGARPFSCQEREDLGRRMVVNREWLAPARALRTSRTVKREGSARGGPGLGECQGRVVIVPSGPARPTTSGAICANPNGEGGAPSNGGRVRNRARSDANPGRSRPGPVRCWVLLAH